MSEYLSKKTVLEWLESEMSINKGHPDDIDIHWTLNRVSKKILSGAFDADNTEIQRLRAALSHIHVIAQSELDELQYESQRKTWEEILLTAEEALSTTTEPKQDKTCVICGTREGKYLSTANRWFCEPCTDALPPVNANAAIEAAIEAISGTLEKEDQA